MVGPQAWPEESPKSRSTCQGICDPKKNNKKRGKMTEHLDLTYDLTIIRPSLDHDLMMNFDHHIISYLSPDNDN